MSKYNALWQQIDLLFKKTQVTKITLPFDEVEKLGGVKIDHSFLNYKKELEDYCFCVEKISLKEKQITFGIK